MPYIPPGGRDWNKNGTYDWSDRFKDYKAYEIFTGNKHPLDPDAWKQSKQKNSISYDSSKLVQSANNNESKKGLKYFDIFESSSYIGEYEDRRRLKRVKENLESDIKRYSSLEEMDVFFKRKLLKNFSPGISIGDISWLYVARHEDEGFEIAALLLEKVNKCCDLIIDLLNQTDKNKENRKQIYLWSCEACSMLCRESVDLLKREDSNRFYRAFFEETYVLVREGLVTAEKYLKYFYNVDVAFKIIIGMHSFGVEKIMKCLDKEVFLRSPTLQTELVKVALEYNKMCSAMFQRSIDYFMYPHNGIIETHWEHYQSILQGIPQHTIDTLEETGWTYLLDKMETDKVTKEFAASFRQSIQEQRAERRKLECEVQMSQFKTERPNVCKKIEKLETEKKKKEQVLEKENAAQEGLEEKIQITKDKIRDLQDKMQENQEEVRKLSKKIFGKRKALEQIQDLETAQKDIQNQSDLAEAELRNLEQLLRHQKKRCSEQQERIRKVSRQISEIKEKNHFLE